MKVLVAGTFDILHPGHIYLLEEAAKLGEVYVVVARDRNVEKLKGMLPVFREEDRIKILESLKAVRGVVLGDTGDFFRAVVEIDPDIILLGPDQDEKWVKTEIQLRGLRTKIMRLEKKLESYSSTEARRKLGR